MVAAEVPSEGNVYLLLTMDTVCMGLGPLSFESEPDKRNVLISYANAPLSAPWVWMLRCSDAGVVINCFVASSSSLNSTSVPTQGAPGDAIHRRT